MVSNAVGNFALHRFHRMHLLFGANTDVGKSIVSVRTIDVSNVTFKDFNFAFLISVWLSSYLHLSLRLD